MHLMAVCITIDVALATTHDPLSFSFAQCKCGVSESGSKARCRGGHLPPDGISVIADVVLGPVL